MTAAELARLISRGRYRFGHETLLQDDVEALLVVSGVSFRREHIFGPADRVDFFVEGHIALELKVKGQRKAIFRQLERYSMHDCVDSLVLGTLAPMGLPAAIGGKPAYLVSLGRTGL